MIIKVFLFQYISKAPNNTSIQFEKLHLSYLLRNSSTKQEYYKGF